MPSDSPLLLAKGAVLAMTGELLFGTSDSDLDEAFGEPVIATLARRGDIVRGDDEALGTVYGICADHQAIFVTDDGLERVALADCTCAWRVG